MGGVVFLRLWCLLWRGAVRGHITRLGALAILREGRALAVWGSMWGVFVWGGGERYGAGSEFYCVGSPAGAMYTTEIKKEAARAGCGAVNARYEDLVSHWVDVYWNRGSASSVWRGVCFASRLERLGRRGAEVVVGVGFGEVLHGLGTRVIVRRVWRKGSRFPKATGCSFWCGGERGLTTNWQTPWKGAGKKLGPA